MHFLSKIIIQFVFFILFYLGLNVKQSKTSKRWLQEHFSDTFVKQAHDQGLRSRAYFKLEEMDKKENLFSKGMRIVDLGAAPGGWSQYISKKYAQQAEIFALDILPMESLPGVQFICGDFTQDDVLQQLMFMIDDKKIDVVISDMAPNWSGCKHIDIPKAMYLSELALDFAKTMLRPGGSFLIKLFQGEGFDQYLREVKLHFKKVSMLKPLASRDRSREVYLLGKGFKSA